MRDGPWNVVWIVILAGGLSVALVNGQVLFPPPVTAALGALRHPWMDVLNLVLAAVIGVVVTLVHQRFHRDRPLPRSLGQAQILLCVAGALIMLIIGDSVARAFGALGAASIIRFRTPVEDPKDTTILFLLLALGMASGTGLYWIAGLGTVFLCLLLAVIDSVQEQTKPRAMMLQVIAEGAEFPAEHVQRVLGASVDSYEPREMTHGKQAVRRYHVTLDPNTSLSYLSQQLVAGGAAGVATVSWENPKKSEA